MHQPTILCRTQTAQAKLALAQTTGIGAQWTFDATVCARRARRKAELAADRSMRVTQQRTRHVGVRPDAISTEGQHVRSKT